MAIISQIITDAYRESNNIAVGQTPSPAEQQEALILFNRFLRSVFGTEAGENFVDYNFGNLNIQSPYNNNFNTVPTQWWVPQGSARLFFNNSSAQVLYLNPSPQDGDRLFLKDVGNNFSTYPLTIYGNGRTVGGSSNVVFNTSGQGIEYFYRADTGNWSQVSDLALSDTFPFPEEFEDLFSLGVAMRINPRTGAAMDEQSIITFKRLRNMFRARYRTHQAVASEQGLYRLTNKRYCADYSGTYPNAFNLGVII